MFYPIVSISGDSNLTLAALLLVRNTQYQLNSASSTLHPRRVHPATPMYSITIVITHNVLPLLYMAGAALVVMCEFEPLFWHVPFDFNPAYLLPMVLHKQQLLEILE